MSTTTTETKLQHSFSLFQINFPYTRMFRYDTMLVYSPSAHSDKVFKEAQDLIEKLNLPLLVEKSKLITRETIAIKGKD